MTTWFNKNVSIEDLKPLGKGTMTEHLGIELIELGKNFLKANDKLVTIELSAEECDTTVDPMKYNSWLQIKKLLQKLKE